MATLAKQTISGLTGQTVTPVAATSGGDQFANDGSTLLLVVNGGTEIDVTINSQTACDQGSDHDVVVTVGAGATKYIGPFPKARFDDGSGNVLITYEGVTSVTVAALGLV